MCAVVAGASGQGSCVCAPAAGCGPRVLSMGFLGKPFDLAVRCRRSARMMLTSRFRVFSRSGPVHRGRDVPFLRAGQLLMGANSCCRLRASVADNHHRGSPGCVCVRMQARTICLVVSQRTLQGPQLVPQRRACAMQRPCQVSESNELHTWHRRHDCICVGEWHVHCVGVRPPTSVVATSSEPPPSSSSFTVASRARALERLVPSIP